MEHGQRRGSTRECSCHTVQSLGVPLDNAGCAVASGIQNRAEVGPPRSLHELGCPP